MTLKSLKPNRNTLYYLIAFILPVAILGVTLFSKDIFINSKTTILASDGFHQYVIFAENLRNILHDQIASFTPLPAV